MTQTKVLIVDDEEDFSDYVVDIIEDMGFEVVVTNDPHQFTSLFSEEIDIVILDLFMPGIDGIELLRYIPEVNCHVAVVFMSGKDKDILHSAQELAMEQGIAVLGTLQKPFTIESLEQTINNYVPTRKTQNYPTNQLPTIEELKSAIDNHQLFMVYQPQVNISDRNVIGVEALIRWKHPEKGMISPAVFIPFAEENSLISEITSFSAREAILQAGTWKKQGYKLRMSINMSPKTLNNLSLPEVLAEYIEEAEVNTSDIMIEVTETAVTVDLSCYMDILTRLRMKGFELSIDDFGTGYSSLQQLVRVPFTELKVDQAFVSNLEKDQECHTITEISILLAHKLGMHVVAEGIEKEEEWNILQQMGCDQGQGYWIGKPMSADAFEMWMKDWSSRTDISR